MPFQQIIKRNGQIVDFDLQCILVAIEKAEQSTLGASIDGFAEVMAIQIEEELNLHFGEGEKIPTVEEIQDIVEQKLVESGNFEIAKKYILYRAEHAKRRAEERLEQLEKIDKNLLKITKRNGQKEVFRKEKLKALFDRAAAGIEGCPFEEVYEIVKLMLTDNISTKDLMKGLQKACLDCISVENIAWQQVAGRLMILDLYGEAARNREISYEEIYAPKKVLQHVQDYIAKDYYYRDLFEHYSEAELLEAAAFIDPERDFSYGYSTVLSFTKRYLLNRNKEVRELPQEMYLMVALFLAVPEPKEKRLQIAKEIYEVCSTQKLSLPTPTLLNARTNYHQLSSCFKLNVDDDLRGIYHQFENMAQISKFGGGVGAYFGHVRSKGGSIRGVKGASGGVVPWMRVVNDTAYAVNQLGARLGAISPTIDVWHRDIHDFLDMQTESGDIRKKAFDIYPAISVPDLFMQRCEEGGAWTLFDPHEIQTVTGKRLEDHFCEEFEAFYLECEQNPKITLKETISAKDLMKRFLKTTVETGMPYVFFRDTVNRVNPNKHVGNVYATQLCTEICQNTTPPKFIEEKREEDGTISIRYQPGDTVVCNLASVNMAKVHTPEDIKKTIPVAMRVLDNVITLNYYPIEESKMTAEKYRSVGLGFMGLAEHLACSQMSYDSEEARDYTDKLFEEYAYATIQASADLAKERGAYPLFEGSEWSKGILFGRDEAWYKQEAQKDWSGLIADVKNHGLRFGYHLAPAPNTSTANVVGTTAGLLPVYKKLFVETNSLAPMVTVAPNLGKDNFWYYKEYRHLDMMEVIKMFSVIYKWIDQSISFEWMIDPAKTSPKQLYDYYVQAWKSQIKTVYYVRSLSGEISESCESCSG